MFCRKKIVLIFQLARWQHTNCVTFTCIDSNALPSVCFPYVDFLYVHLLNKWFLISDYIRWLLLHWQLDIRINVPVPVMQPWREISNQPIRNHNKTQLTNTWWRHQMETFSALLAICAGNSPVHGEFPTQRPVTRSFDVFCDLPLHNRLSKQSWGWWLETLWRPLSRHRNEPCVHLLGLNLFGECDMATFTIMV